MHDEFRGHARPPGDHRGGLPQGRREDRGGPPRRVPARRREARQDAARALEDRRRPRASTVPDADVEAEVARGRERYAGRPEAPAGYFESERGRSFIRSTLRRSRVVETLIDDWLAAHPEHPPLPHLEDAPGVAPSSDDQAEANAAIDATDPGSILADDDAAG